MRRPRVTVNAAMFAPAIWIQARFKSNVRTVVPSDNALGSVAKILRLPARWPVLIEIGIDDVKIIQIDMQLLEPIRRAPRSAATVNGLSALRRLLDDWPEFLARRHEETFT